MNIDAVKVSTAERDITITLNADEAREAQFFIANFINRAEGLEPIPYLIKLLRGALAAVSENREHGGH